MSIELSLGTLETDAPALEAPGWDTPFRFALLGDFSGRANRGLTESPDEIVSRKGKKIDRENFEQVLADLCPQLTLDLKGGPVELSFSNLDDFHADQIIGRVERFDDLSGKERSAYLSSLLHHPDFKALEATWLGVDWFLRKAWKGDNGVEIVLYDLTGSEFVECLNGNDDLSQSPLYAWLIEKAQKGYNAQPWGAIVGLYSFEVNADNAQVLGRMAKIARHAAAPFLSGLGSRVWEKSFKPSKDDAAAWQALRSEPAAAMLGLAAPGFLLRPPYGASTRSLEKMAYEEFKSNKDAEHYVLGNPALFCAALLAKSFTKKNWSFKPGSELEFDQMATHVARDEDDEEVLYTVSDWLTQKSVDQMTKMGFMTLRGVKGRNQVQLARYLPLAEAPADQPSADLIGSWGQKALKGVPRTPSKMAVGGVSASSVADPNQGGTAKGKRRSVPKAGEVVGAHNLDDLDELMASADALEAQLKAEREAAEAAGGGGDSSDPFGSDFGSDSSSDLGSDFGSDLGADLGGEISDDLGSETPTEEPSEEMDPELAALMGDLSSDEPAAEPDSGDAMDPELEAMLREMDEGNK